MEVTKELARDFLETIPSEAYMTDWSNGKRSLTVGVKWGFIRQADKTYVRDTVMAILNKLETDNDYFDLLKF